MKEMIVWDFKLPSYGDTIRVLVEIDNERIWMTARKKFFAPKDFVFERNGKEMHQEGYVLRYSINEENDVFVNEEVNEELCFVNEENDIFVKII